MRVKYCGITNKDDALNAVSLGVDAIGFIFYEESRRCITIEKAQEIIYFLPPFVTTVGIFVNADYKVVNTVASRCHLDMVQLHGDESPDYCMKLNSRLLKAFRVNLMSDIEQISQYQGLVSGILLDSKIESAYGGTGKVFDWGIALAAKNYDIPLILSGGLCLDNIEKAIEIVNPDGVDISSGIEVSPGVKDYNKMKQLISKIKKI